LKIKISYSIIRLFIIDKNVPSIKTGRNYGILAARKKTNKTIFNNGEFDPGSG
jgi:hypothetical protein